jgi:hypothetical protein
MTQASHGNESHQQTQTVIKQIFFFELSLKWLVGGRLLLIRVQIIVLPNINLSLLALYAKMFI